MTSEAGRVRCLACRRPFKWDPVDWGRLSPRVHDVARQICGPCLLEPTAAERRLIRTGAAVRRHGYLTVVDRYGMSVDDALRLVTATACDLCGTALPVGIDGRHRGVVDHDHRCCRRTPGCGNCVRGILCGACNAMLGGVDAAIDLGLDRVLAYVAGQWGQNRENPHAQNGPRRRNP